MVKKANDYARGKIRSLVNRMGIKKVKLGEVLGSGKNEAKQQLYLRGKRFLDGSGDIKIEALSKIALFFNKPISYFFPKNLKISSTLSASEKTKITPPKPLEAIKSNLEKLGYDEDFVEKYLEIFSNSGSNKTDE